MSISGWLSGQLGKKHLELCKVLNIDRNIGNNIWIHFLQYYDEYLLEGDPFHWLGCCIYLRYPSCSVPPSSNKPIILNLTRLLRNTNLSLVNFFQKTKRWAEISGLGEADLVRFESLQRGFAVSMAIFKSYKSIFIDMIGDPLSSDTSKGMKSKRTNKFVPSIKKLFEFTWRLYISVKSSFPEVQNDLVHSYHLLLAACDFIFANAFLSKMDIINPKFPDYKNVITSTRYGSNSDIPCIIDILCRRHNGVSIQAKQVKEYFWKKQVKSFFDKKLLKGNIYLLSDIIGPNFLDINMKNIDRFYEDYILCLGVFDERLFLAESFFSELAGSNLQQKMDDISNQLENSGKLNYASSQGPSTPLTARRFLKDAFSESNCTASPSSYSSMATLQSMLYSRSAEPSHYLQKVLKNIGDLNPSIETRVSDMAQIVYAHFTEPPAEHERWSDDLALSRVDVSKKLYYRFLDKLIAREMNNPSFNCKLLLSQDIFHKTLFACAVEVVLFTYRSPWVFPWILETLHISAYHFSRIIEVVVIADELLSREMIKHLNWVEEIVLERLAWKSDSPLWKAIIDSKLPIPSCEDVSVRLPSVKVEPQSQDSGVDVGSSQSSVSSQSGIDRLASLAGSESVLIESPGVPLSDKFQTPNPNCPLKRQADTSNDEEVNTKIIVMSQNDNEPIPESADNGEKVKARRTGAIALFFRKFYYLSSVRLQDMCDQLSLMDVKLRQKIWTSFELIIINYINMMIDRHLDQILMCSIYVICKIVGPEQKFTDMMKCYRNQPQAQSSVYRNVLLGPERTLDDLKEPSGLKTCIRDTGDLIQFYNAVFLNKVEDLVRMFKFSSRDKERIVLSPIPYNSSLAQQSPRRKISDNHNVYIKYLSEKSQLNKSPNSPHFTYCFTQSPMKSLKLINNVISAEVTRGKKLLSEDDSENIEKDYSCSPAMNKKVIDLLNDRRAVKNFSKE